MGNYYDFFDLKFFNQLVINSFKLFYLTTILINIGAIGKLVNRYIVKTGGQKVIFKCFTNLVVHSMRITQYSKTV